MLNLKSIALKYDIPYDPVVVESVGSGNVYYETEYHMTIPIIAVIASLSIMVFLGVNRYKERKKKYEQ